MMYLKLSDTKYFSHLLTSCVFVFKPLDLSFLHLSQNFSSVAFKTKDPDRKREHPRKIFNYTDTPTKEPNTSNLFMAPDICLHAFLKSKRSLVKNGP